MNLRLLRCAVFDSATASQVQADVNAWAQGQAVSVSATFAALFVKDQQFVAAVASGTRLIVLYTE